MYSQAIASIGSAVGQSTPDVSDQLLLTIMVMATYEVCFFKPSFYMRALGH